MSLSCRVLNYNILVPHWAEHEKPSLKNMPWDARKGKLVERMVQLNPDCICLQEVEKFNEIQVCMSKHGYKGISAQRNNGEEEGCAIFYKEHAFDVVPLPISYFNDGTGRMVLGAEVKPKTNHESFYLFNTHVVWDSSSADRRKNEINTTQKLAFDKSQNGKPVIVCADFNTARNESGFFNGFYQNGFEDTLVKSGNAWKNSFVEKGSNGLFFTTYDYVFSKNIELSSADICGNPNDLKDDLEQMSLKEPSDHLPMLASFNLKSVQKPVVIQNTVDLELQALELLLKSSCDKSKGLSNLSTNVREALKWGFWIFEGMPEGNSDFGTAFFLQNPTHPTVFQMIEEMKKNGLAVTSPILKKEIDGFYSTLNNNSSDPLKEFNQLSQQTQELIKKSMWVKAGRPTDKGFDFSGDVIRNNSRDALLVSVVKQLNEQITY